jgi:hypothetical protein
MTMAVATETSHVLVKDSLGVRINSNGIVAIEQRRIGGTEAWVSITIENLEKILKLAKEDLAA